MRYSEGGMSDNSLPTSLQGRSGIVRIEDALYGNIGWALHWRLELTLLTSVTHTLGTALGYLNGWNLHEMTPSPLPPSFMSAKLSVPPHSIPDEKTVSAAAELELLDKHGNTVKFGQLFQSQKTIVVFVRAWGFIPAYTQDACNS
jgi:hypothetical protein